MKTQKRYPRQIFIAFTVFFTASILLLWSWNTAMVSIFGVSVLNFKQAVALLVLLGIGSFFIGVGRRQRGSEAHYCSGHHGEGSEK